MIAPEIALSPTHRNRSAGEAALTLDRVTKHFGDHVAVDDLTLRIPAGSIYGFLGPNGAGKTTTIRMVMSILAPDEGRIRVLGDQDPLRVKDRLGYLPEERGLYKKMKTSEILAYYGRLKGLPRRLAASRANDLLERHGLGEWRNKRCESLSKGMGQKVQLLGTLIHEPDLVILDEPFSGLDPVNADLMREVILSVKAKGRTVIFSTHAMEHAEQMCDYIVLINKGRKVLDGTMREVRHSGDEAILLEYVGDATFVSRLPSVRQFIDAGNTAEIRLEPGSDPQELLAALVGRVQVRRFELREPSLHEVFVRAVGGRRSAE